MAITLDAETNASQITTGASQTFSHVTASGATKIRVGVTTRNAGDHSGMTVTYDGVSLNRRASQFVSGSNIGASEWELDSPNSGTHDVVITFATSVTNWARATATTLFGTASGAPEDADQATGSVVTVAVSLTSTEGAWVFASASDTDTGPYTNTGGQVGGYNYNASGNDAAATGRLEDVTAGIVTPTWTVANTANPFAIAAMSIAVAAAGGATFIPLIGRGPGMASASRGGGLVG